MKFVAFVFTAWHLLQIAIGALALSAHPNNLPWGEIISEFV